MNNEYFVYYDDDFPDNGGVGMEQFNSEKEALDFIQERISIPGTEKTLDSYTLIVGKELKLHATETITKVEVDR